MHRTPRTLLLSAVALGSLATAAAAAPPTAMPSADQMAEMHAEGGHGAVMHSTMMTDPAMQADCPMLAGSMANMHGTGDDHQRHHD